MPSGTNTENRLAQLPHIFRCSQVMQLIEQVTGIANAYYFGAQRYVYKHGYIRVHDDRQCEEGCLFQAGIATGDSQFPLPIGHDHSVVEAHERQISD